ncbi:MAG: hypothetical protein OXR66_04720 [Candidatus Woesearchaeota archaeon]|nr:hypothetical protein [Candidatus Woesearchaeota archaeon]
MTTMHLIAWANAKVKKMTIWDVKMVKWAMLFLGMIIGAYVADFVKTYVVWFVIACIMLYVLILTRIFR